MRTASALSVRCRPWKIVSASVSLLAAGLLQPCHAQYPAPEAPPYGADPQPPSASQTQNAPTALPEGVSRIYALTGTNDLLAMATPDGYDRLRELVRNLDGDLDAIRTRVVSVDMRICDMSALGVSLDPGKPTLTGTEEARLISAFQAGSLRATETLRITTRENTPVDTTLRNVGARDATGGTPFTLIPRENKSGLVTLEIHQPLSVQVSVPSGQTAVLAMSGARPDTVRLLFLTPSVLAAVASARR